MGNCIAAAIPARTMIMDITDAKMGRRMKNWLTRMVPLRLLDRNQVEQTVLPVLLPVHEGLQACRDEA